MTPGAIADSIVNLCGAIGLSVAMIALYRRDPRSPLTRRLLFLLGVVAVLFLMRGVAWWSGNVLLDGLSMIPAAMVPLGALIVTEGMLRRHAPRIAKRTALWGAILLGLGAAFGLEDFATPYAIALSLFQLAGFATCAWLLASHDRDTLLASENRSIGRLAVGALLVIPFVITDFRVLAPDMPVRLGALGALFVVTAVLIAGGSSETRREAILMTTLRLSASALLGIAAAFVSDHVDAAQIIRFCAIAISGVLNSVAASLATTREELILELARHPLFESARRFRESDLVGYDPPLLREFLAAKKVLRRPEAPWGFLPSDPAVERLLSLMAANSATHIIILSHDPADLIVLSVPVISADPATETALALVRRILALTPESA
jgi:hypothetical protein